MKHVILTVFAIVLVALPLSAGASLQGLARITLTEGDVQVRMADDDDWVPAAVNTPLEEGDSVWSPEGSRVEIQLQDGTYIRLAGRSALDIVDASDDGLQFHLGMGRAYIRTGSMRGGSYQFDLTESTVTVTEKARLRLDITAEGDEDISVIKGSAYVEGYGGRTRVRSGETISLEGSRSEILPLAPPDRWEKWNRKRDQQLKAQARSTGYLPEELTVYEDELARSGEWVQVSDYGRVWRPTVIVSADWAPYRVGRWIWRGGDYVWVSYESWGWVPYHYGRWVVTARWGWCWVPPSRGEVYWAPAYVGWVTTPRHVAWVPLAPGEIYYGRGYYGRGSVNITNVTNINVTNVVYRNHTVTRNAATVVDRGSFSAGRMNVVKTRENVLSHERSTVSRPEPPRTRAARMPLVKPIAPAKLPPPKVANTPARELKHRLPRIEAPATPGSAATPPVRERQDRPQRPTPGSPDATRQPTPAPPPAVEQRQQGAAPAPSPPEQPRRERRQRHDSAPQSPSAPEATAPGPVAPPAADARPPATPGGKSDEGMRRPGAERRAPRSVWELRGPEDVQPQRHERAGRPERQDRPERPQQQREQREPRERHRQ